MRGHVRINKPFYQLCTAPRQAWRSFRLCALLAILDHQLLIVCPVELCSPAKKVLFVNGDFYRLVGELRQENVFFLILLVFFEWQQTFAFFQLEIHGGIFHSCCSFTETCQQNFNVEKRPENHSSLN